MMKKKIAFVLFAAFSLTIILSACGQDFSWKDEGFDLSLPTLGEGGWYEVFTDNFDGDSLNGEIWTTSPHAIRWPSDDDGKPSQACYWCDDMVSVKDGCVEVRSAYEENHACSKGVCPAEGRFTGGIETRKVNSNNSEDTKGTMDELLFSQAFGYFETRVKLPDVDGLWSAFWLQSSNQRNVSHEGLDGTEIDVYESAFRRSNSSKMGHALLWNGYGNSNSRCVGYITELKQDLYDGFHTFALKWTPEYYVFYIDGVATWATRDGGVSKVAEFLRLTVETDAGDGWGPHSQKIGKFDNKVESIFYIDYVKVYQNAEYIKYQIDDSKFSGSLDLNN